MENKQIYFAGGCFWGTERFFQNIYGVVETEVGFANGNVKNPTYEQVCTGNTGFTEAVKIVYNDSLVTLPFLIDMFFLSINPTTLNMQGFDIGTQYRSGIYYVNEQEEQIIQEKLNKLQEKYKEKIVVENKKLENFYEASEYHQNYLIKNPSGYCHISTELFRKAKKSFDVNAKFRKKDKETLKSELTQTQFEVTQLNYTEPPFANEYHAEYKKGIYVDVTTGEPLFSSTDKFESGCGWPSFSKPIIEKSVTELSDTTHNMKRVEVRSTLGDAHLGHVFNDGPKEKGGLRYCINSASLKFIEVEKMKELGYEKYIEYVE